MAADGLRNRHVLDQRARATKDRRVSTVVRSLRVEDLDEADHIFRVAFGTFLGFPDPATFGGDVDYVRGRFRAAPAAAFAADHDGRLAGSVFAVCWGSVGFFGPLSVRPDLWNRGVAQRLLEPVMACFDAAGVTHAGLFTFAQSAKHVGLYGKLGFHPRFLTAVMGKPLAAPRSPAPIWARYGMLDPAARARVLADARVLTDGLHSGLDLGAEIAAVAQLGFGETVLLQEGDALAGFAVCHVGAGTEAGGGNCYVKFGAVPTGPEAARRFGLLLDACEAFAAAAGAATLTAGVNLARDRAYADLLARGFRTVMQGVAMHRPNAPGYSRPEVFALDDWR
jgi:GNAT superfamily N-acetyltransferase